MPATSTQTNNIVSPNNSKIATDDFFDDIIREAGYRRCLILDGNVKDLFDDGNEHYLPLPDVLLDRLADMEREGRPCFSICAVWDPIDGIRFLNTLMQQNFQRVLGQPPSGCSSCACPSSNTGNEYDDGAVTERHQPAKKQLLMAYINSRKRRFPRCGNCYRMILNGRFLSLIGQNIW